MITNELISRINELSRLKKQRGLSAEEALEQTELRDLYLQEIRARVEQSLEQIQIEEQDGSITPLKKRVLN